MRPGKRKALDPDRELQKLRDKVEHPFQVIKQRFGFAMVRLQRAKAVLRDLKKAFSQRVRDAEKQIESNSMI